MVPRTYVIRLAQQAVPPHLPAVAPSGSTCLRTVRPLRHAEEVTVKEDLLIGLLVAIGAQPATRRLYDATESHTSARLCLVFGGGMPQVDGWNQSHVVSTSQVSPTLHSPVRHENFLGP